ncbi:hypothetical protein I3842_08G154800 [Carya illinoinensis]|uniref:Uncharacterized protein n=1 Tax=Carya illinoinensis TaxID=32201 RepID=A0A922EDH9_CARIL|nr:hypothetical protein I3842_08G154800 [Carya illinoinensis]
MEKLKLKYFKRFLKRIGFNVEILVNDIKLHEERVRDCYAESIELSSDHFVKLILVDGSFLIEFFYGWSQALQNSILEDRLLQYPISLETIMLDLPLLENHLPFLILEILFRHACVPNWEYPSFTSLAIDMFEKIDDHKLHQNLEAYEIRHFTDLARAFFLPSSRKLQPHVSNPTSANQLDTTSQLYEAGVNFMASSCKCLLDLTRHLAGLARAFFVASSRNMMTHGRNPACADHLYTASQLDKTGVKFKVSSSKCFLDLKFTNGTFEIPCMDLSNSTETTYRNVIAFEQCHNPFNSHFTNYIVLLTFLITTPKDVDFLMRKGIIINGLGSSNAMASFLNNLGTNVPYYGVHSIYRDLFEDLNAFCENPKHIWKAALKRDYFSTPWRIASTVATGILLLLTLEQFICSIIQVVKK